ACWPLARRVAHCGRMIFDSYSGAVEACPVGNTQRKWWGDSSMPGLQTVLGQLNSAFTRDEIGKLVEKRESFAPGKPLAAGVVVQPKMALYSQWTDYLNRLPRSMQEAIRSTIYHALSTSPPTQ